MSSKHNIPKREVFDLTVTKFDRLRGRFVYGIFTVINI